MVLSKTRMKPGYTYHMRQSVEGPLMNWTMQDWNQAAKWTRRADGTPFPNGRALKEEYLRLHGEGWKVLPVGDCDNFDKVEGCLGHRRIEGLPGASAPDFTGRTQMAHDKNGVALSIGDIVEIEATIIDVCPGEDYCNLTVKSVAVRKPDGEQETIVLNAAVTRLRDKNAAEAAEPPAANAEANAATEAPAAEAS